MQCNIWPKVAAVTAAKSRGEERTAIHLRGGSLQ